MKVNLSFMKPVYNIELKECKDKIVYKQKTFLLSFSHTHIHMHAHTPTYTSCWTRHLKSFTVEPFWADSQGFYCALIKGSKAIPHSLPLPAINNTLIALTFILVVVIITISDM